MRFTEEKTAEINNQYKAMQKQGLLPLEIYGDKICATALAMCDIGEIRLMIKSLEELARTIEDRTGVQM